MGANRGGREIKQHLAVGGQELIASGHANERLDPFRDAYRLHDAHDFSVQDSGAGHRIERKRPIDRDDRQALQFRQRIFGLFGEAQTQACDRFICGLDLAAGLDEIVRKVGAALARAQHQLAELAGAALDCG